MDSDGKKFGKGPREPTGAVDLISHYKLLAHHDLFCKRPLPLAISDTHYLRNVVGDTEIRKGEGMELDQLLQNAYLREKPAYIQPFDMETLGQAFQLRETAPVDLPSVRSFLSSHFLYGVIAFSHHTLYHIEPNNRLKKVYRLFRVNRKVSPRTKRRSIKSTKTKTKTRSIRSTKIGIKIGVKTDKDKDKKRYKSGHHDSGGDHSKKHHEKKRKHEGMEDSADVHKHKKSKHKSLKTDEMGNGLS